MTQRHPWGDRPTPDQDVLDWHREARKRDEAYLAQGPMDMTETTDGPWAYEAIDPDPDRPFNDTVA